MLNESTSYAIEQIKTVRPPFRESCGEGKSDYLISPRPPRPILAQLIFGHPATGDSGHFLDEAIELAELGIESYLLNFDFPAPEVRRLDPANLRNPQREVLFRKACLEQIVTAADLVSSRIELFIKMNLERRGTRSLVLNQEKQKTRLVLRMS